MDADEITLIQDYKSYFQNNVDPITVTNGLRTRGCINASHVKGIYDIDRKSFGDRVEVWKEVMKNVINLCSFPSFLSVLDTTGYTDLSLELSVHIRGIKGHLNDVVRLQRGNCRGSNHKFAQELFVSLKINTHNNTFKNPRENLHELSQRFRARFLCELDSEKKMLIADKYAASLCAEIDSHTMLYVRKFPTHGLFQELENLIPETSNTHVAEVAFKSRMAIACAIAEDTERGEEFLTDARVASYHIGPCVQLDNMLYIQVFNYLCKFENNPTDDLRDTIIKLAGISLQVLEEEDDVTRTFWKRMFLLRMVYCLLGISNRCDIIPRCVTRQKYVNKARQLMAEIDKIWDGIESRRRMFYHVARARLHDLDSRRVKQDTEEAMVNIEAAIFRIEKAKALGEEGGFGETCYVKLYASELNERKLQLILQQTGGSGRAGHEHLDTTDRSMIACEHDSHKYKNMIGQACENTDLTSYQPCSSRSLTNPSSDYDTSSLDTRKVLHHPCITDKDKCVSCQKNSLGKSSTHTDGSPNSTDHQSSHSPDIRHQMEYSGDTARHQVVVSQQDMYRPSCVQREENNQHVESYQVYQPGKILHAYHQPAGENVSHLPGNAHCQSGNFPRECYQFDRITNVVDSQRPAARTICQPQSEETQSICQPDSATNQQIDIQVNQQDLRQPESTTHHNCDVYTDTSLDGHPRHKDIWQSL